MTKQNFKFFWAGDGSKSESVDTLDEEVGGFNFTRLRFICCINRLSLFTPSLLSSFLSFLCSLGKDILI